MLSVPSTTVAHARRRGNRMDGEALPPSFHGGHCEPQQRGSINPRSFYAFNFLTARLICAAKLRAGERNPMRKKTPKLKPAYSLLKTSKKKDVELTEKEPGKATGGCGVLASRA